jgi:hypothetical protein
MYGSNLFGNQTNPNNPPQQTGGGLFVNTGLFGNANPVTQQQPTGFHQQPQSQQQSQQSSWGTNLNQPQNMNKGLFTQPSTNTGGIFGSTPSTGNTGINLNKNLGIFGSTTTNPTMQPSGMGFSSSVFPQTAGPGMMTQPGNVTTQPSGGIFGTSHGVGGVFGTQTTGPTQTPGFNIFGQQPQTGMQPTQPSGTGLTGGMGFGLGQQPQQQQTQPMGTGLFGTTPSTGSTNVFGGPSTTTTGGLFGQGGIGTTTGMQQQQPPSGMGVMGKTGGMFSTTIGPTQPSGFQTGTTTGFGPISTGMPQTQVKGTHMIKYQPTRTQESSNANGSHRMDNVHLNTITAMPEFSSKSIEELRYEDFSNKKLGIVPQQMGATSMLSTQQPTTSTSMFGTQTMMNTLNQPQKSTLFQGTSFQTQQPQQNVGKTSMFQTGTQNQQGLFGTQPTTQTQPQQGIGLFQQTQQPGGSTGGLFSQQQTTSQFGGLTQTGGTNLGSSLFQQKSIMSPGKTTTQTQPSFGMGFGGNTSTNLQPSTSTGLGGGAFGTTMTTGGVLGGPSITNPGFSTGTSSLFGSTQTGGGLTGSFNTGLGTQLTSGTTGLGGGLFQQQAKPQQTPLFGSSSQMGQPTQIQPTTGLFDTSNKGGLVSGMQNTQGMSGSLFTPSMPTQIGPSQQQYPTVTQVQVTPESADFKNYLTSSMYKQKSITELLNDLQRHYLEQDFFLNEDYYTSKPKISRDINLGESKYTYGSLIPENRPSYYDYDHQRDRYDIYGSFLKSKRNYYQPKSYASGGKGLYREPEIKKPEEPKITQPGTLLDFNFKKEEHKPSTLTEDDDEIKLKKSHSCDSIKRHETVVVNNLGRSFFKTVNIEDERPITRAKKLTTENIIDIHISLQEPIKISFNLKINKNSKITFLKTAIVEQLKEKYPKMFRKLNTNSFVLMKKYSILKDSMLLSEAEVKDNETIHILLKENFNTYNNQNGGAVDNSKITSEENLTSRKESIADKKKKKNKEEIAPLNKLPILNKPGYKTNPEFRKICRMTLGELEDVENFSIFNEYGRIDFEGVTDLTNLNLDQIVTIDNKRINVYQNGDLDFKPPVGQGLNKPAVIHLYKCYPADKEKNITDEQLSLYLASLQKICKEKGAEFKSYDRNTGEWIFKVEYFV